MAHEVETMMYAGELPWHGLGTRVEENMTAVEAMTPAGIDWKVATHRAFYLNTNGDYVENPNAKIIVRESDGAPLGVGSNSYEPIQNEQLARIVDAIVGSDVARCEAAGSLLGGKKVWFLMKLKETTIRVPGDKSPIDPYFLGVTRHDGSGRLLLLPTPVRVVCANTVQAAVGLKWEAEVSIAHVGGTALRIEKAIEAVSHVGSYYERFTNFAEELATTSFTDAQMWNLTRHLMPAKGETVGRNVPTITKNNRDVLFGLFEGGKGHEGIRGTAWAAYNAVAEYADHMRKFRSGGNASVAEGRANAIWFGTSADLKAQGLTKIRELVKEAVPA